MEFLFGKDQIKVLVIMNDKIKSIIDPRLYNCILELSKDDLVLQQVIKKSNNLNEFVNALLAGIICVIDRQQQNELKISQLLNSNPEVKKILELKNDQSMLSKNKLA